MEAKILSSPLSMCLFNLAWIVGASAIPMGVSTPPKWSRNLPMCLKNLQRTFGAWGPNRSWNTDLPTLPCLCSTFHCFLVLVLNLLVCQHLPSGLRNLAMCLRNLQRTFGARDPNSSWNTDFPTLPYICSTWYCFLVLVLCPQVCHLPSDLQMFLCVLGASKIFGAWGPNRSLDIDLPTPNVFDQLGLGLGAGAIPMGVSTSLQVV